MWLSINGTLTHSVATALHLRQAHEVEQCQLRGTRPRGRGCRQGHCRAAVQSIQWGSAQWDGGGQL